MSETGGLLLDTCAVLWLFEGAEMADTARTAIADAVAGANLHVSPISAWEIGMLVSKERVALSMPAESWVESAFAHGGISVADLSPRLLVQSSFLPGKVHGDPADRIILATARELGLKVVTRDKAILEYARQGHVGAILC